MAPHWPRLFLLPPNFYHYEMLPSEKIELAIYSRVNNLGPGAVSTTLPLLCQATGADHLTVIERLEGLEQEHRISLSKYNGGSLWPYARAKSERTNFFSTGAFTVEITPAGRKYFEQLEAADQPALSETVSKSSPAQVADSPKQTIFISCGQRTTEERGLGLQVCEVINEHPNFRAYFADLQNNLRGLHENILDALGRCAGFVAIMHPRGTVSFSGDAEESFVRASVWVEQEIAIASYVQRTSEKQLHVAAYAHKSVKREGLRDLLQLNPFSFTESSEVLHHLASTLQTWHPVAPTNLSGHGEFARASFQTARGNTPQIKALNIFLCIENIGHARIREYMATISVPTDTLAFTSTAYTAEIRARWPGFRSFRTTEKDHGGVPIYSGDRFQVISIEVAVDHLSEERRDEVLQMDVIGEVLAGDEQLRIRRSVGELMSTIK